MNRILIRKDNSAILLEQKANSSIPSALSELSYHRLLIIMLFIAISYLAICGRLINIVLFQADLLLTGNAKQNYSGNIARVRQISIM